MKICKKFLFKRRIMSSLLTCYPVRASVKCNRTKERFCFSFFVFHLSLMPYALCLFFTFHFLLFTFHSFSQGAAINSTGAAADNSAMLDISSTNQGIRIPRVKLL
ncbi:MAG: hypothetical protein HGB12_04180, partial [Bacteroidetes bacterium]|nr:hypothetical protein [Bacteroidota bacterium]